MKNISRPILVGALALIFLSSGCRALTRASPTPVWTVPPEEQPLIPTATGVAPVTSTGISVTPLIPITGENVVSMQCQFCVDEQAHAVLIFPEYAYFDVVSTSPVSCLTAEVVNGRRVLFCRGEQETSFNLNICYDSTNCLQFPVALQACPLLQNGTPLPTFTPFAPFFLTPINTLNPPDPDTTQPASTATPSLTPTTGSIPATPTFPPPAATTAPPPPTATSVPPTTEPPPPTEEPPTEESPTSEPEPTTEPTDSDENNGKPTKKPSRTPRPTNERRP